MNTIISTKNKHDRFLYILFTSLGLISFFLFQDTSWAGINLALALVFNPFNTRQLSKMSFAQKSLIIGQMAIAGFLIGWNLHQVMTG